MDKDFLHNPHDCMFRELFTRLDSAAGFLREVIPPTVSDLLYSLPVRGGKLGLYALLGP